jgi:hypothetical protein
MHERPAAENFLINHRERLRLRELGFMGLFLLFLSSVLTLGILHQIHFGLTDDTERQLKRLGKKMANATADELRQMHNQLADWCKQAGSDLDEAQKRKREVIRKPDQGPPKTPRALQYPSLANVFWTDDDGQQVVKWSATSLMTPLIDISGQDIYQHSKSIYLEGTDHTAPFYFTSVQPPNKFDYLATLTMKTLDCNAHLKETPITAGAAFLTAKPLSLIDPILPYGFGFALVNDRGLVLFHSDKRRNLRENFEQETDGNRQLQAAIFSHGAPYSMQLKYMGKDYRARVFPIPGVSQAPWSLIVFRDLDSVRTVNLQALTMSVILLLGILGGPILLGVFWGMLRHPGFAPEWLWPHRRRLPAYRSLIYMYGLLTIVFLAMAFGARSQQSVAACAALPYAVLVVTVWAFRRSSAGQPAGANRTRLPSANAGGMGILALLTVLVLKCGSPRAVPALLGWVVLAAAPVMTKTPHSLTGRFRKWYTEGLGAWRDSGQSEPKWLNTQNCYQISALMALLLLGVLLPMALFRASAVVERRLAIKQAQVHLAAAITQRRSDFQEEAEDRCSYYALSTDPLCQRDPDGMEPNGTSFLQRTVFDTVEWGIDGSFKPEVNSLSGTHEFYGGFFSRLFYLLHQDYNDASAEMLGVIRNSADREKAGVSDRTWDEDESEITLRLHGLRPWPQDAQQQKDLKIISQVETAPLPTGRTGTLVAVLVMLAIGALFLALARKVFLFHVLPLKITGVRQVYEFLRQGRNVLVLLPPVSDWQLDMPKGTLDLTLLAKDGRLPEVGSLTVCRRTI